MADNNEQAADGQKRSPLQAVFHAAASIKNALTPKFMFQLSWAFADALATGSGGQPGATAAGNFWDYCEAAIGSKMHRSGPKL